MKKLILLLLFIPTISISQVNKNNVVFKDGVEMNMNEFITICKNSANNVDGIEAYCLCFLEKIAYNYTSEEYISMSRESVMSSSNKIEQANTFLPMVSPPPKKKRLAETKSRAFSEV